MTPAKLLQIAIITAASALPLAGGISEARPERLATNTGKPFATIEPEAAGIRRFAEIRPGLTRGGEPGKEGLQYLRERGYRTVVSFLTSHSESATVVQSGMNYVHIPIRSGPFFAHSPTKEQVRQFLSVVTDSSMYPIFIHCHAGKDRTGAMSAIYRMEVCGWTVEEAVEEMKAFGFAGHYRKLLGFVRKYPSRQRITSLPAGTAFAESK